MQRVFVLLDRYLPGFVRFCFRFFMPVTIWIRSHFGVFIDARVWALLVIGVGLVLVGAVAWWLTRQYRRRSAS